MLTNFLKSDINKDSFPLKDKTHTSFWCGSYLLKNITQLEGLSKNKETAKFNYHLQQMHKNSFYFFVI